jgi:tRNA(Ile)-lysidine synthase
MPESIERDGVFWKRPWLRRSRDEIDAYVRRHRIKHIEDDSNADPRFARNRLRIDVWPALVDSFDSAETTLAMAASWAHEASDALDELAAIDLARIAVHDALQIDAWLELSQARRSNALRAWIKSKGEHASASLLSRLLDELPIRRNARWPLGTAELRAYRGTLRFNLIANSLSHRERAGVRASTLAPTTVATPDLAPRESQLSIRRAGTYALPPWSGALRVERVRKNGVPLAWLAHLELRERSGGEQFQAGIDRPPRSLKKQFQQAGVPMWERTGPLVYSGGQLVFVPGLGLDARVIGLPGQAMATLHWVPTVAPV